MCNTKTAMRRFSFGGLKEQLISFVVDWEFKYGKSRSSHTFESKETRRSKELFLCENVRAVTVSMQS